MTVLTITFKQNPLNLPSLSRYPDSWIHVLGDDSVEYEAGNLKGAVVDRQYRIVISPKPVKIQETKVDVHKATSLLRSASKFKNYASYIPMGREFARFEPFGNHEFLSCLYKWIDTEDLSEQEYSNFLMTAEPIHPINKPYLHIEVLEGKVPTLLLVNSLGVEQFHPASSFEDKFFVFSKPDFQGAYYVVNS